MMTEQRGVHLQRYPGVIHGYYTDYGERIIRILRQLMHPDAQEG